MTTQLKLISVFAIIAIACGGLCFRASVRAQSATFSEAQPTPEPDANKKEGTAGATPAPSPTATPKR